MQCPAPSEGKMGMTIQIVFRGVEPDDAIEAFVRNRMAELVRAHRDLLRAQITIDQASEQWGADGGRFRARVVVVRTSGRAASSDDLASTYGRRDAFAALDAAFDRARAGLDQDARAARARAERITTRIATLRPTGT
ncbi:MAG TPA: HPF/RaiA family ribosome-associated protein [Minicystis sp.]|nr:HPF/RaiA family ribosome-associated protein [Minicystis sp.]